MRIELTDDAGQVHDVTEAVQIVYDLLTSSMDYGSGFLDWEDIEAIKRLAEAGGWEQPEYQVKFCGDCHHDMAQHRQYLGRDAVGTSNGYEYHPCRHHVVIAEASKTRRAQWRPCGCEATDD